MEVLEKLPKDFEVYIIDLDGVVYKGDELIADVDTINDLISSKRVIFLTNNSTLSRRLCKEKLRKFGIDVYEEDIITSSYLASIYVKSKNKNAKVFCVGEYGLVEEMEKAGLNLCRRNCDFVVVGLDRNLTYNKLSNALEQILGGAEFIATNKDRTLITEKGILPGAGAVVAFLEYSSRKRAKIVGKPSKTAADIITKMLENYKKRDVLLIGDRLETDIVFGRRIGVKTALVLTGVSTENEIKNSKIMPDYIIKSL